MSWKNEFVKLARGKVLENEPLAKHTTFRVGGPALLYFEPADEKDLAAGIGFLRRENLPHMVIGQGSNLLFSDAGYRGCIVRISGGMRETSISGTEVICESGALLFNFVNQLAEAGLAGFEGLSGIPGTVGGAVFMNAGAFEQCVSDNLLWVEILDETGSTRKLEKENLLFRYRWSLFHNVPDWIILRACFQMRPGSKADLIEKMKEYSTRRKKSQPWDFPSAGSFFKNPPGRSAGSMIDKAGLKGQKIGGAEVSEIHANFIVNTGGATCEHIVALMKLVQKKVYDSDGITLEPEVKIVPSSNPLFAASK